MTDNVVPFRKPDPPPPVPDQPLFTIAIFQGDDNGFSWIVTSLDKETQPGVEQLSQYLGDMFFALNPQPPSILERLGAFFSRLNPFRKGRSE